MRLLLPAVAGAVVVLGVGLALSRAWAAEPGDVPPNADIWGFTPNNLTGQAYPLEQHRGQVLLIVNTASRCGFTSQYEGLQALFTRYRERGLTVIGVPSNDFLGQEPGTAAEIQQFCSTKFNVSFPLLEKVRVKSGREQAPLFAWLTSRPGMSGAVGWNFNKFLIGRDGRLIARYGTRTKPDNAELLAAVEAALAVPVPTATGATGAAP
jgi:glutathione peroxidase